MFHATPILSSPSRTGNRENLGGTEKPLVFGGRVRDVIPALGLRAGNAGNDMSQNFASFLKRWMITTVAVMLAANIVPGITYTASGLILATLLLGLLNAFVRPIILVLSLPFLIMTLGLFLLFINALLLYWVGHILRGFHVETFTAAFWGSLIVSIVSMMLNMLMKGGGPRVEMRRGTPPRPPSGDGGGPVIDV
jgi:putative membrane protein